MINVRELRIGNWVETYIVLMSGYWIDKDGNNKGKDTITETAIRVKQIDVNDLMILQSLFATYRPIPLTTDILEKVLVKGVDGYSIGKLSILLPNETHPNGRTYFNSWCIIESIPKSLHQLQNLYFY